MHKIRFPIRILFLLNVQSHRCVSVLQFFFLCCFACSLSLSSIHRWRRMPRLLWMCKCTVIQCESEWVCILAHFLIFFFAPLHCNFRFFIHIYIFPVASKACVCIVLVMQQLSCELLTRPIVTYSYIGTWHTHIHSHDSGACIVVS